MPFTNHPENIRLGLVEKPRHRHATPAAVRRRRREHRIAERESRIATMEIEPEPAWPEPDDSALLDALPLVVE